MNKLSNQSLVVLVQLVQKEVERLASQHDRMDAQDPLLADLEQELVDYSLVADELKGLYEEAEESSGNLPKYRQLAQ
ncbi:hypothetical protein Q4S45_10870 [Massilia sp. R2A-15]|uniref:hypothetical protein n=1 Tax=Massilia sp. R2A-15 TaxID=3064278 RepID=UPI0027365688|nr:hypothetical protein [Massilia sp. R2A-15]WLI91592.1 hypothetical protein Q4S45_10870 [Massilia sp. R2A-15]